MATHTLMNAIALKTMSCSLWTDPSYNFFWMSAYFIHVYLSVCLSAQFVSNFVTNQNA